MEKGTEIFENIERENEVKRRKKLISLRNENDKFFRFGDYNFKAKKHSRKRIRANGGCLGFWRRGRTW